MANEWYVQVMGEELGPLSDDQLRDMVAKRRLTTDDVIRKGSSGKWVVAANVRGLFQSPAATGKVAVQTPQSSSSLPVPATANADNDQATFPQIKVTGNVGNRLAQDKRASALKVPSLLSTLWRSHWRNAAIAAVAALVIGYFFGREHLKYQVRSAITDIGNSVSKKMHDRASSTTRDMTIRQTNSRPTTQSPARTATRGTTVPTQTVDIEPQPVAPAQSPIRQRFQSAIEEFLSEAQAFTNLPKTGPSVLNMMDQHKKVQQAFARIPDPQNELETACYKAANNISLAGGLLVVAVRTYNESLDLDDRQFSAKCKASVDATANDLKGKLQVIEAALNKFGTAR